MRHALQASHRTIVVAGAACLLGVAGLAGAAQSERVRPAARPVVRDVLPAVAPETDADRRARLNARLQQMLTDGNGARLTDPARHPVRAAARTTKRDPAREPARARLRAATTTDAPVLSREEPVGTIAPPAPNPFARASANRNGRYVAPRLDLTTAPRIPENDIECLTQAIYYEARNESEAGQAAVAEVVINRSRHGAYPRSICAVVYQRNSRTCQFTFTCDGSIGRGQVNMTAWRRAERIAREVQEGRSSAQLPKSSVNYHANYVRPSWGQRLQQVRQIGAHIFYGAPLNGTNPGAGEAAPARQPGGIIFVRNEALDRAYALLTGQTTAEQPAAAPAETGA
ncbi:MAG TPA: cell wall hydrolase [Brevundimonas sp.]|uniref:cell wall hydrolase n=1 Tax=Brevundimonas sp. TaxID=1871086 RepID=UPI0026270ACF|nr:cell wall hydrolase [Brevundimonas sp.]HRO32481.1 cell wall hydrolase [Brevundimonas sp.]